MPDRRIVRLELPDAIPAPTPYAEADRRAAVHDLLMGNRFDPKGLPQGPFALHLAVRDGRLLFDIRDQQDRPLRVLALADQNLILHATPHRSLPAIMPAPRTALRDGFRAARGAWAADSAVTKL